MIERVGRRSPGFASPIGFMMETAPKESLMKEKIEQALNKIRPALQGDGGDVELVEVGEDGVVRVRLKGACGGCPMSQMTLKMGIERILKKEVPEIKSVEAV
jgi:Fe-S cluster biogenesis protein NfuA